MFKACTFLLWLLVQKLKETMTSNLNHIFRMPFAAGQVFSASMLDTLLYQVRLFYLHSSQPCEMMMVCVSLASCSQLSELHGAGNVEVLRQRALHFLHKVMPDSLQMKIFGRLMVISCMVVDNCILDACTLLHFGQINLESIALSPRTADLLPEHLLCSQINFMLQLKS